MSIHSTWKVRASVRAVLGLALAASAPAFSATPAASGDALDEVVVTAQFREQNVQTAPLSITALSGALLESRNQTSLPDVANQAPNVTLKPQGAAFGPSMAASIRGVGQYDFNPALEPGVGIYVDDVYYASLTGSILDLLDLDRVEILRGPQGTLSGRNSIGGAIKLYSKKASGEGGYISGTYGSRNRVDLRASGDFQISDTLFARISGVSKRQGGYITRYDYGCKFPTSGVPILSPVGSDCVAGTMGDVNYSALRGTLRWVPSDTLEVSTSVDYTDDNRTPAGSVLVQGTTTVNRNVQPIAGVSLPASAFVVPYGSYYNYASYDNPRSTFTTAANVTSTALETRPVIGVHFKGWGASTDVDWKLGGGMSLKSITAYRAFDSYFANDNDLSPLASSLGFGNQSFHSFSEELRLNGALLANDRIEYTLGAFYMNQGTIYATTQDLRYSAGSLTQFVGDDPINADSKAAFAHLSFHATDKLTLIGGLRYTDEHKDYTFSRHNYDGTVSTGALGAINGYRSNYDGDRFDYRANVQYQWTDSLMSYAQFATGFKGGGISPRPFSRAQAVPFNPEKLDSYEAGVKSDLFDRRLRVNGSVFYSKYKDMLLTLSTCPPQYAPTSPCAVVTNAGDAEMKGLELETNLRVIGGLSVDAAYSYLNFKYTYINPLANGIRYGMYPAYVPKTKASIGMQYEFVMGDLGTLTPRIDASYQGALFANASNAATNLIDAYTLVNARLTWRASSKNWETSLEVTNLTDKYYYLTRFDQYTTTGVTDGQPGRPREWAITVKRKF